MKNVQTRCNPQKSTHTHTHTHTQVVLLCLFSLFNINAVIHQGNPSVRIEKLLAEKQAKMKKLESCKGTTKNLKIAGLSTLGITAVGVAGNIAEAVILKDKEKDLQDARKHKADALAENEKIVKAQQADEKFKDWCLGDGKEYTESNKSCTISQSYNDVTDESSATVKIKAIVAGECGSVSKGENNTYTAKCTKDGHDVTVTITGKAAEEEQETSSQENAEVSGGTAELDGENTDSNVETQESEPLEQSTTPTDDDKSKIDEAFKAACAPKDTYHLKSHGSGADAENTCYVQVSTPTQFNNALGVAKNYVTKMKDVGCNENNMVVWTDVDGNPASDGKQHYFVNCRQGTVYNRFYVHFSNITCDDTAKEFQNGECVYKVIGGGEDGTKNTPPVNNGNGELIKNFKDKCKALTGSEPTQKDSEGSVSLYCNFSTIEATKLTDKKWHQDIGCGDSIQWNSFGTNKMRTMCFDIDVGVYTSTYLVVDVADITCSNGEHFDGNQMKCVSKNTDKAQPVEEKKEAPKAEEKVEAVARNKDGTCDKCVSDEWSYSLKGADAEICDGMVVDTWKVADLAGVSHCSDTEGDELGTVGVPSQKDGVNCWCKKSGPTGSWVFTYSNGTVDNCAHTCARDCARNVLNISSFRAAVFE